MLAVIVVVAFVAVVVVRHAARVADAGPVSK